MLLVIRERSKELFHRLFDGEMVIRKKEFWLVTGICMMFGVFIGLLSAPLTKGITICCGNNNGNKNSSESACREDEACRKAQINRRNKEAGRRTK